MSELQLRLADLARASSVTLEASQCEALENYLQLLARWNATINLTSLALEGFPEATLNRLVAEALVASRFMPSVSSRLAPDARHQRPLSWFDLGSGGGSPAIPLKIVRPEVGLTMVESRERKSAFLREVIRALGLRNTIVVTGRLEDVMSINVDIITVRAVSWNIVFAEAVSRILAVDGRLLVFASTLPRLDGLELDVEAPLIEPGDRLFVMKRST